MNKGTILDTAHICPVWLITPGNESQVKLIRAITVAVTVEKQNEHQAGLNTYFKIKREMLNKIQSFLFVC